MHFTFTPFDGRKRICFNVSAIAAKWSVLLLQNSRPNLQLS